MSVRQRNIDKLEEILALCDGSLSRDAKLRLFGYFPSYNAASRCHLLPQDTDEYVLVRIYAIINIYQS